MIHYHYICYFNHPTLWCINLLIRRITGCLEEETRVPRQLSRFTRRRRWRSRGSRSWSNNSFCLKKKQSADWEETCVAEAFAHLEETGFLSRRMRF